MTHSGTQFFVTSEEAPMTTEWRFPGRPGMSLCSPLPRRKSRHVIGPACKLSHYQSGVSISAPAVQSVQCIAPRPPRRGTTVREVKAVQRSPGEHVGLTLGRPSPTGNCSAIDDEGETSRRCVPSREFPQ